MKENKRNMLLNRLNKYKTQSVLKNQHSPGKQLTKLVEEINLMSGVDGSVGQPKASKPEVPGSTPGSS